MKSNLQNNIKKGVVFVIIIFCVGIVVMNIQYKGINIKNISLFVLVAASIYFGVLLGRRKKVERTEEDVGEETTTSQPTIPEEFKDEENRFTGLDS